jgi:hypothetical protein
MMRRSLHNRALADRGTTHMNSMTLRALSVALLVAGAAGASACGSSTNEAPDAAGPSPDAPGPRDSGRADAGHADSGHADSGHVDASHSDAEDAADAGAPDCGAIAPTGTQLVASTDPLILQGSRTTSDGYAFYLDANTQELFTIPAVGGTPAKLGIMTSQSDTFWANGGKAALFLTAPCNPETLIAPLWVWSAATGPKMISSIAFSWDSFNYTYDATQDGTQVAFFVVGGSSASLSVTSPATGQFKSLVDGIDLTSQSCWPFVQFVGDTIVAYYCLAGGTAPGSVTVASFAGPSFTQTTLATFPAPSQTAPLQAPGAISPDATHLLLTPAQGAPDVALYPIAGGGKVTVSATGQQAAFARNGDVVFIRSDGTVQRYVAAGAGTDAGSLDAGGDAGTTDAGDASTGDAGTTDAGGPLTLVGASAGLEGLLGLSADGNWLQVFTNYSQTDPYPTNVDIASASTPGPVTTVWSPVTASAFGFTTDSKFEAFAAPTGDAGFYELGASSVSGGSLITIPKIASAPTFTTSSKLILGVNGNALTGSADLRAVDLANPSAASTLVTQADPFYFYTGATSNQLLYSWHCAATSASGVWALTAPQ